MKRRILLSYAATATATTAALAACSPSNTTSTTAGALPNVRWKMATSWPTSLKTLYGAAQRVAQRVSEMTDGRFSIQVFAAGEIVPGLQVLDAVQQGTVECGHSASYYYIGKNPALAFGTAVPFGLNAQQQNAWLYHGGGLELIQKLYSDFNTIAFPSGNSGVQMGGWFKREVNNVSDLQGLKMRIPGLGGEVLSRLGVNVQVLPGGEIFLALDRGAIDAAEWVGPFDDEKLGLNKAAKFYYYPGWWEPGSTFDLQINLTAWNKLPKEYQEIVKAASIQANMECLAIYDTENPIALKRMIEGGTQLKAFSSEIMTAAQQQAFAIYEENASKDATFKTVYEQWKKFRETIYPWSAVSELAYGNFTMAPALQSITGKS
ncbi:TRAP transporter substrate-binding protein [Limnoraphis robusta]|uniref:TRAP transporter substrate-binding protein n=1 Tax=Limnoraphis robusta CCNP1315 TaxID=3110306 RepID=A0ABU5U3J6_9CYAN|nr:TRAP transporter substrate-binding protein [Limnoraphis robusta]MEA5521746.1 TRAP transporter substrate-binding protein [Limnoraphis robusta CCNP1315]MEA5547377.1 TRAP transporter substrate-binding protein [Limnoraphis robusta CCNP1324]